MTNCSLPSSVFLSFCSSLNLLTNRCIGAAFCMIAFNIWFALSLRCVLVMPPQCTPMKYGFAHLSLYLNSRFKYSFFVNLYVFSRAFQSVSNTFLSVSKVMRLLNSFLNLLFFECVVPRCDFACFRTCQRHHLCLVFGIDVLIALAIAAHWSAKNVSSWVSMIWQIAV